MKKIIPFLILLLACQTVFAQFGSSVTNSNYGLTDFMNEVKDYNSLENKYENIEGSQYHTKNYQPGKVFLKEKDVYIEVALNYNMFEDEFEFKTQKGKVYRLTNLEKIDRVEYNGHTFKYFDVEKGANGYYIVLAEGQYGYCKKVKTVFKDEKKPQSGYDKYEPPRFLEQEPKYFVRSSEGTLKEITTWRRKKFVSNHFDDNQKELLKWMKENRINIGNEEEMIQFFNYLNSLEK